MKPYLFFTMLLGIFAACSPQPKLPISLYEGIWSMETDEGTIFEEWEKESDSLFTGISYVVKDGDTIVLESIKIKYEDGKLCYAPTVLNQNEGKEVLFLLKEYLETENKFVFENLMHDFPQRIIYHFKDNKNLSARLEGEQEGRMKSLDYSFKKQ